MSDEHNPIVILLADDDEEDRMLLAMRWLRAACRMTSIASRTARI
jgi:hypothetical protein